MDHERQVSYGEQPAARADHLTARPAANDGPPGGRTPLVEWLRAEYGDALRSVFRYDGASVAFLYERDDVTAAYSESELDAVADEISLRASVGDDAQADLYHLGALDYEVQGFETGTVVRVALDEQAGVGFSVTPGTTLCLPDDVQRLVETLDWAGDGVLE